MKCTVIFLFLFMASFIVSAMEPAEFNRQMNDIRKTEQEKQYASAVEKYKEFLKSNALTQDQKSLIYERLAVNSVLARKGFEKDYETSVKWVLDQPDSQTKRQTVNNMISSLINVDYEGAKTLFTENSGVLSVQQQINLLKAFASYELNTLDKPDVFASTYDAIKAFPEDDNRNHRLIDLIVESARLLPENGEKLMADLEKTVTEDMKRRMYQEMAVIAVDWRDRQRFDKYFGKIKAMPFSAEKISSMIQLANISSRLDTKNALNILKELYAIPELTAQQKFNIINMEFNFYEGNIYGYAGQRYDLQKELRKEFEELFHTGELKNVWECANFLHKFYRAALWSCDYEGAYSAIQEALKLSPDNGQFLIAAAELAFYLNDAPAALNYYKSILDNEKSRPEHRRIAKISQMYMEKKPFAAIQKELAGMDITPDTQLALLYEVSESLFKAKRYEDVRRLNADIQTVLFRPDPGKKYTCYYMQDAPRSADGWARSSVLNNSKYKETRFERLGDNIANKHLHQDQRRLKTAEIVSVPKEYETAFYMVYDEDGIHMYVHCKTPDAEKIRQGFVNGDSLELTLQPGVETAYHSWFFDKLPGTDDPHDVVWDTPHKNYRLTYDYFRKDGILTEDAMGAYTFIPWTMFYDKLPTPEQDWGMNFQRWGKHQVTLGGTPHDIAPALHVKFDISGPVLAKIKRNIALQQYAKYKKLRNDAGAFILTWNDELLGDPEFFKTELEPLLKELDENGEKLLEASDRQLNEIYDKYVPQWAEITFVVAEKRRDYVKNAIFAKYGRK